MLIKNLLNFKVRIGLYDKLGAHMDTNKMKEGMSVKEMEMFAKKHRFEVFFCLSFILACFFSFVMFGTGWAIILTAVGGILGVLLPGKIEFMGKKLYQFIFKQEDTLQLILGIVGLGISVFVPPIIFLMLGAHGGKSMYHLAAEVYTNRGK